MATRLCYISQDKLYLKPLEGTEDEIASDFASDLKKRLQVTQDRAAIRGGSGAAFMRGGLPGGEQPTVEDTFRAEFSCATSGTVPGEICYAIDAREVRGLFIYDPAEKYERRVLHGPKHRFSSISTRQSDDGPEWLVAAAQDHGVSRIGLFNPQAGGGVREITEGDSLDSYPVWIPGASRRLVYQTCGVARDHRSGAWLGLGPASLQRLDLESGSIEPVIEDERFDFLCPAFAADGTLHYLKRPYEPFHRPSFWRFLLDIVLFPFRLLRALLSFLNVFSMMFSGKPLQTAGTPPPRNGPDPKSVFLHGRWVNMEKAMRDSAMDELTTMVPKNWELVRHGSDGSKLTISQGVMAYAVSHEGTIYYSNGRGVFSISAAGAKPVQVSERKMVTSISVV